MESLTLTIESHTAEDLETEASIDIAGKSIKVGRRSENDWVLPDSTRHISGHHFDIRCEDGHYDIYDLSTNGTFINGSKEPIKGSHRIVDGDRIQVGAYVMHAQLRPAARVAPMNIPPAAARTATNAPKNAPVSQPGSGSRSVQAPPGAAFLKPGSGSRVQAPGGGSTSARPAQAPDFSRFQTGGQNSARVSTPPGLMARSNDPAPGEIPADALDDILDAATPSDATPQIEAVETPKPDPEPQAKPDAENAGPFKADEDDQDGAPEASEPAAAPDFMIPDDDFTLDLPKPETAPPPDAGKRGDALRHDRPVLSSELSHAPVGRGETFGVIDPAAPNPAEPFSRGSGGPFGDDPSISLTPRPVEPARDAVPRVLAPKPEATPPDPKPAPEPAPAEPAAAVNEFLLGFLEGAGIDDAEALQIPLRELGKMLGQCARMSTQEMMQMLQDRSNVKLFVTHEDRTMRIASGNNPMKFMLDPDEAFQTLFVVPRDGYQTGPDGFENALTDIRKHQAAMMAAVQPAMADMLAGLAPKDVEAATGSDGGGMLGGGARKCWDEYNKRWTKRASQGENGMLDAFVAAFARRYTEALNSL